VQQVATQPATDPSAEGNFGRFIQGVGPFGLHKAKTVTDILGNLP